MRIILIETYGPFRKNDRRIVVREGRDFYAVRSKGKLYYVPKAVCEKEKEVYHAKLR